MSYFKPYKKADIYEQITRINISYYEDAVFTRDIIWFSVHTACSLQFLWSGLSDDVMCLSTVGCPPGDTV